MLIVQCTKKISEQLNIKLGDIDLNEIDPLYSWHANLFLFNRKKGVILMNNKTYYNIVLFGLRKEHFSRFATLVTDAIRENFKAEGFSDQIIERYLKNTRDIFYTKTHDRSILGQMNDMILMTQYFFEDYALDDEIDILNLNKQNNRTPMVKRKHSHAIDALKEALHK